MFGDKRHLLSFVHKYKVYTSRMADMVFSIIPV